MTDFRPGALARVPFPYTDRAARQHRPAVVIANGLGPDADKLWVLMVTSAENPRWPGDIAIEEGHAAVGLPAPSLIRTEKVAVIDAAAAEWRGDIGDALLAQVRATIARHLG
jgi:mRNA interferase MazF